MTPKESVLDEVHRVGLAEVVGRCEAILSGRTADPGFYFVLAGPASRQVLDGREGGPGAHWPKVWALRALLYAWGDSAQTLVVEATRDRSWRVREMAARVIAHEIDDALESLDPLVEDPVPRVRAAATRARIALTRARH